MIVFRQFPSKELLHQLVQDSAAKAPGTRRDGYFGCLVEIADRADCHHDAVRVMVAWTPPRQRRRRLGDLYGLSIKSLASLLVADDCHGFDNGAVADAIRAKHGAYCGVALAPASVDDAELKHLDGLGFRGLRFNFMQHLGAGAKIEDVIGVGARLAALNMHLQVHFESSMIHDLAPWFRKSAVPVE